MKDLKVQMLPCIDILLSKVQLNSEIPGYERAQVDLKPFVRMRNKGGKTSYKFPDSSSSGS